MNFVEFKIFWQDHILMIFIDDVDFLTQYVIASSVMKLDAESLK